MTEDEGSAAQRISGTIAAASLFAPAFAGLVQERLCVAYLDAALLLLRLTCTPPLHARRVEVPIRDIVRDALSVPTHAIIVAHNHPDGTGEPSPADRRATRKLAEVCRMLDMRLIDHLLFAGDAVISFRELGFL